MCQRFTFIVTKRIGGKPRIVPSLPKDNLHKIVQEIVEVNRNNLKPNDYLKLYELLPLEIKYYLIPKAAKESFFG
jgi:hypothetical protein